MMEKSFIDNGYEDIRCNLLEIHESIADACTQSGRKEEEVALLAVTKTVPAERINAAIRLGRNVTPGGRLPATLLS